MTRRWRYLNTGAAPGAWNMAVDNVLCRGAAAGEARPVLRLYQWAPPAVSLGYAQRPDAEVDTARCRALGVDVVRRPTGGRAVLHWEELTYSVVCREDDPQLGGSIGETNRLIGQSLAAGLARVGVQASVERSGSPGPGPRSHGGQASIPCFSSTARWEVTCAGRKLAGSAQRRFAGAVLQHGSLLTGPAHARIVELLPGLSEAERDRWCSALEDRSTHLGACGGASVELDALAEAVAGGFSEVLGAALEVSRLEPSEQQLAAQLAAASGDA